MGIKGLNSFLKKNCPSAFIELPNSDFKGKRIAIDSNNVLYRFMSRAHKEIVNKTDVVVMEPNRDDIIKRWLYHVKNFLIDLIKIGATPIFVFDGVYISEKSKTQEKRRADKQKMIDNAENMKMKILEIDELERTPAMVTELRKKMQNLGYMGSDEKEMIKGVLSAIGIPVLIAKGEGEQLCAMLCIEGKVDAVYSLDTDLIAFGCPLTIKEPAGFVYNNKTHNMEESFKCTIFKPILSTLGLEYKSWLDLCIMAGCDFNDNMPHLGVTKSYNAIRGCGSIDNLPAKYHVRSKCTRADHSTCSRIHDEYEDQTVCLNYVRCREIMSHISSEEICQDEIQLNIRTDLMDARDRLEIYGVDDWLRDIVPLYRNVVKGSDVCVPKYPSLSRSSLRLNIGNFGNTVSGNGPTLNIVPSNMARTNPQRTPNRTNTQRINNLSKTQHSRLAKRFPHLVSPSNRPNKEQIPSKGPNTPGTIVLNIVPK